MVVTRSSQGFFRVGEHEQCPACSAALPAGCDYCLHCGILLAAASRLESNDEPDIPQETGFSDVELSTVLERHRRSLPLEAARALVSWFATSPSDPSQVQLHGLASLPFVPREYQAGVASRVVGGMHGRAILADEVGLGKTIEAGLIINELKLRRLVRRTLILVPSSLVDQWAEELTDKFGLKVAQQGLSELRGRDVLLMSIHRAKMEPMARRLLTSRWDMVIVDEAHSLKNSKTIAHKFVKSLQTRYLLLLTATPIENDLREIYNLLTLVNPVAYTSFRKFAKDFLETRFRVRDVPRLREFCQRFLIRNRRQDVIPEMPPRFPRLVSYYQHDKEKKFYDGVIAFVRSVYRRISRTPLLVPADGTLERPAAKRASSLLLYLTLLLKESCSSPQAVLQSLVSSLAPSITRAEQARLEELAKAGNAIQKTGKMVQFMKVLRQRGKQPAIAYVEFLATHRQVSDLLQRQHIPVIPYTGRMSQAEKQEGLKRFREKGGILLCTEVGGQGLNLQHCDTVINFDLPWNPMRLEQRIGRVHRFGQEKPVNIINFISSGTYEEYIYDVIVKKLDLFRQVVGEVEVILSFMDEGEGIEQQIARAICESDGEDQMKSRFQQLAERVSEAANRYRMSMAATRSVLDGEAR